MSSLPYDSASAPYRPQLASLAKTVAINLFPGVWLWALTIVLIVGEAIAFRLGNKFLIDKSHLPSIVLASLSALPFAYLHSRQQPQSLSARILRWCMLMAYLVPTMLALALFDYLIMANNNPWMEASLSRWDQAMGFDWLAYAQAIADRPVLSKVLNLAYAGMIPALILVATEAVYRNENRRAIELIAIVVLSGLVALAIGAYFPAVSAMDVYGNEAFKAQFPPGTGNSFMQEIREVRGSIPKLLDITQLAGITFFPSYHTICGLCVAYGARGAAWRFWPSAIFSGLLIAATPVYGGHYLSDVLAGAGIACCFFLASAYIGTAKPKRQA